MACQSYRERMKVQRAEARAKREAEKAEYRRRLELSCEVRRLALEAVKAGSGQAVIILVCIPCSAHGHGQRYDQSVPDRASEGQDRRPDWSLCRRIATSKTAFIFASDHDHPFSRSMGTW